MKFTKWILSMLLVLVAGFAVTAHFHGSPALIESIIQQSPDSLPVIVHTTWKASPSQAVGIYGSYFGTTSTTQVAIQPLSIGVLNPANTSFQLSLQDVQNNLIEGVLPSNLPNDVYAVWVNNGMGWSSPAFINRAEVFWASEGEVYPGQPLRLFGRNFRNPTTGNFTGLQVDLATLDGRTSIPATVTQASDYSVDIMVPATVQPGVSYTVEITNGAGGSNGWAQMEDQTSFTAVADNANIDALNTLFNLHAAWAGTIPVNQTFNVSDYGAIGDGVTDDTKAIQAALDAAGKAHGGIVNIPAGTYLASTLSIQQNTVLMGAGMNATKLIYNNLATSTFTDFIYQTGPEIGIADLSIVNTTVRPASLDDDTAAWVDLLHFGNGFQKNNWDMFMENVDLQNSDGNGISRAYGQGDVIIEHSVMKTSESPIAIYTPDSHVRIRDNMLTNTVKPAIIQGSYLSQDLYQATPPVFSWVEGNTFVGSGCESNLDQVGCAGISGHDFGEHRIYDGVGSFQYIVGNISQGEFGGPSYNDGEGILFQPNARIAYSKVSTATDLTMTDITQTFKPSELIGAKIAIIGGAGIGQLRTITANTADQVTVGQPWQIIPNTTSIYTIDASVIYHNIVVDNNLQAIQSAAAIDIYTKSYDNIVADNTISNSQGITTNAVQMPPIRADFAYFNYVASNTIHGASDPNGNIGNSSLIGILNPRESVAMLFSTAVYGDEYQDNTLVSIGTNLTAVCAESKWDCMFVPYNGINFSEFGSSISYPFSQGVLVEDNTITNSIGGIHLSNTSYDTLLMGNDFAGNALAVDDQGSIRTVMAASSSVSVLTTRDTPTPPFAIQNITISQITQTSARITVRTNASSSIAIGYSSTGGGNTTSASPYLTTTYVDLANLTPATLYGFHVIATDVSGTAIGSGRYSFTTLSAPGFSSAINNGGGSSVPIVIHSTSTPNPLPPTTDVSSSIIPSPMLPLPRTLKVGDTGNDVLLLQNTLKSLGFLSPSKPSTGYFGNLTSHSLMLFQETHDLAVSGSLTPQSKDLLNKVLEADPLLGKNLLTEASSSASSGIINVPAVTSFYNTSSSGETFSKRMSLGSQGAEVKALQSFLMKDGDYPQAIISGYYGMLTEQAVQAFQSKYGIISYGTPDTTGYGAVGPRTLSEINALSA